VSAVVKGVSRWGCERPEYRVIARYRTAMREVGIREAFARDRQPGERVGGEEMARVGCLSCGQVRLVESGRLSEWSPVLREAEAGDQRRIAEAARMRRWAVGG
jgi:hypothetical protein